MTKKRELFVDYINGLFDIELLIFENNLPKLHETESTLFLDVKNNILEYGCLKEDINDVDKRIKNRLKNKINDIIISVDVREGEKNIKKLLGVDLTFHNVNEVKKSVKKILKNPLQLQNIHTLLILLDDLRNFYLRHKEKNESINYFNMLEKNLDYIDFNLGVSYFLRKLDVELKDSSDLTKLDDEIRRIRGFVKNKNIIGGYKFKLMVLLVQHWISVGEWDQAFEVATDLKKDMEKGLMYSKTNLLKLLSLLAVISNQKFDKQGYEYYINESKKGDSDNELIESELLDMKHLLSIDDVVVLKETLERVENVVSKMDSEKMQLYLRLVRTELAIKEKDYNLAKNYNDVFFIDIHNKQVKEYLDRIYIQRFIILYNKGLQEEIVKLFESKVTQKRILGLEKKGMQLIYPYVIYDLAKYKEAYQSKEEAFRNIYRILDYYQFNNHYQCYSRISECIELAQNGLVLNQKEEEDLNKLKTIIDETLKNIS